MLHESDGMKEHARADGSTDQKFPLTAKLL